MQNITKYVTIDSPTPFIVLICWWNVRELRAGERERASRWIKCTWASRRWTWNRRHNRWQIIINNRWMRCACIPYTLTPFNHENIMLTSTHFDSIINHCEGEKTKENKNSRLEKLVIHQSISVKLKQTRSISRLSRIFKVNLSSCHYWNWFLIEISIGEGTIENAHFNETVCDVKPVILNVRTEEHSGNIQQPRALMPIGSGSAKYPNTNTHGLIVNNGK